MKGRSLVDGESLSLAFYRLIFDGDELKKREEKHSLKLSKWTRQRLADPEKKRTKDRERYARDRLTILRKAKEKQTSDTAFADKFRAKARDYYTANRVARLKQKSAAYYADVDGKYAAKKARDKIGRVVKRDARIAAKAANQV